ncbi:MAG: hypothetical protein AAGI45_14065 [Cyanobacteria bacterium P01_H01_bin.26]
MKHVYLLIGFTSGFLAAAITLWAMPGRSTAVRLEPQLETTASQIDATIEEWRWRDMAF